MKLYCILILFLIQTTLYAHNRAMSTYNLDKFIKKGIIVVDIRSQKEWIQTGIIPGSYKLTYFDENRQKNPKRWLYILTELVKDKNKPFVLVSREGKSSKKLATILNKDEGYKKVYYLKGGIKSWIDTDKKVLNY